MTNCLRWLGWDVRGKVAGLCTAGDAWSAPEEHKAVWMTAPKMSLSRGSYAPIRVTVYSLTKGFFGLLGPDIGS